MICFAPVLSAKQPSPDPTAIDPVSPMDAEIFSRRVGEDWQKRRRINRRNARKSTGPKTPEGKAKSSKNAITHGVFARDLVVAGEDVAEFDKFRMTMLKGLNPHDALEMDYAEQYMSACWKLQRLRSAECAEYQKRYERGMKEQAEKNGSSNGANQSPHDGPTAGEMLAEMLCGSDRTAERIQMYERRLQSMRDKALAQLKMLQTDWPDEPRSQFTHNIIQRVEGRDEMSENEATEEKPDANEGGEESCATDGAQMDTDNQDGEQVSNNSDEQERSEVDGSSS